jgi:hypothetical protein
VEKEEEVEDRDGASVSDSDSDDSEVRKAGNVVDGPPEQRRQGWLQWLLGRCWKL